MGLSLYYLLKFVYSAILKSFLLFLTSSSENTSSIFIKFSPTWYPCFFIFWKSLLNFYIFLFASVKSHGCQEPFISFFNLNTIFRKITLLRLRLVLLIILSCDFRVLYCIFFAFWKIFCLYFASSSLKRSKLVKY